MKELYLPFYFFNEVVREGSKRFHALEPPKLVHKKLAQELTEFGECNYHNCLPHDILCHAAHDAAHSTAYSSAHSTAYSSAQSTAYSRARSSAPSSTHVFLLLLIIVLI